MIENLTTDDVIARLGGRSQAAKTCGVSEWATYKWDLKGIPSLHWHGIKAATGLSLEQIAATMPARHHQKRRKA